MALYYEDTPSSLDPEHISTQSFLTKLRAGYLSDFTQYHDHMDKKYADLLGKEDESNRHVWMQLELFNTDQIMNEDLKRLFNYETLLDSIKSNETSHELIAKLENYRNQLRDLRQSMMNLMILKTERSGIYHSLQTMAKKVNDKYAFKNFEEVLSQYPASEESLNALRKEANIPGSAELKEYKASPAFKHFLQEEKLKIILSFFNHYKDIPVQKKAGLIHREILSGLSHTDQAAVLAKIEKADSVLGREIYTRDLSLENSVNESANLTPQPTSGQPVQANLSAVPIEENKFQSASVNYTNLPAEILQIQASIVIETRTKLENISFEDFAKINAALKAGKVKISIE